MVGGNYFLCNRLEELGSSGMLGFDEFSGTRIEPLAEVVTDCGTSPCCVTKYNI